MLGWLAGCAVAPATMPATWLPASLPERLPPASDPLFRGLLWLKTSPPPPSSCCTYLTRMQQPGGGGDESAGEGEEAEAAASIIAGLLGQPPRISQIFLYDERGSRLYEQIVAAPEYYLPRLEGNLLERYAADIIAPAAGAAPPTEVVVELGAGSSQPRALHLLRAMGTETPEGPQPGQRRSRLYVPVDVSPAALEMNVAASAPLVRERAGLLRVRGARVFLRLRSRWYLCLYSLEHRLHAVAERRTAAL